jgi:hypothetical protein
MFKHGLSIFILIALILSTLTACSQPATDNKETQTTTMTDNNTDTDVTTADETDRKNTPDSLPELDFNGKEIRIYSDDSNHEYTGLNNYIQGPEELTGDIVYDTVLNRNEKVEDRLNVKFVYTVVSHTYDVVPANIRKVVLAGDDLYDIMIEQQWGLAQLVSEGAFLNVKDGKYFDFTQPWWWNGYMDEASIGYEKQFMLAGDYFIDILKTTYTVYFNKLIYENTFGSADDLYQQVIDGKWTMEAMGNYAKDVYSDLNGDGTKNVGDRYGFLTSTSAVTDHFAYGTDVEFNRQNPDGTREITLNNERAYQLASSLYKLYYENEGAKVYTDDGLMRKELETSFMNNELLFLPYSLTAADRMREMESDYGFLPFPKLDEIQNNYVSLPHDTIGIGVIPITCPNLDINSAVLEALCAESYRTVMPAYYETALKIKYLRDELSSTTIDIIHDTIASDFTYIYSPALNDIGTIFRTLAGNKSQDLSSEYAKREATVLSKLASLTEAYMNL